MKPLVLTRGVELEKYEVLMEIGRQERREEFHAVLMLAEELGGRVTASNICSKLLLGRPESVGKAIIDRCRYLDLLDYSGRLTETGKEALRSGEVFIPERGRYILWYTEDPLLPQRLLHLEAVQESSLYDEFSFIKNGKEESGEETTESLSEKLQNFEGRTYTLIGPGGGQVIIRNIDPKGIIRQLEQMDNLTIRLRIAPTEITTLSVDGRFQHMSTLQKITFDDVWLPALGPLAQFWDEYRNPPALKTSFKDLNEKELASFRKTVYLNQPTLPNYGAFENTTVDDVPIIPGSQIDAAQWAKWLLKRSIQTYLNDKQYQKLVDSCKSKFIDFYYVELPSLDELVVELREERCPDGRLSREYWYLQAPLDLRVTEP